MKFAIVLVFALFACAYAKPASSPVGQELDPEDIEVVESHFENDGNGGYDAFIKYNNGLVQKETARLTKVQTTDEDGDSIEANILVKSGAYDQFDGEGNIKTIEYTADQNGYRASGDLVPKRVE